MRYQTNLTNSSKKVANLQALIQMVFFQHLQQQIKSKFERSIIKSL
jgi:hypothetical protein